MALDLNAYATILIMIVIIIAPSFIMMYYTNKKMNSFLGFLGIFILVMGGIITPWLDVVGILIIGLFFYRFVMARRGVA
jgi:hypothetical protein